MCQYVKVIEIPGKHRQRGSCRTKTFSSSLVCFAWWNMHRFLSLLSEVHLIPAKTREHQTCWRYRQFTIGSWVLKVVRKGTLVPIYGNGYPEKRNRTQNNLHNTSQFISKTGNSPLALWDIFLPVMNGYSVFFSKLFLSEHSRGTFKSRKADEPKEARCLGASSLTNFKRFGFSEFHTAIVNVNLLRDLRSCSFFRCVELRRFFVINWNVKSA